jgi:hypothetical protein
MMSGLNVCLQEAAQALYGDIEHLELHGLFWGLQAMNTVLMHLEQWVCKPKRPSRLCLALVSCSGYFHPPLRRLTNLRPVPWIHGVPRDSRGR